MVTPYSLSKPLILKRDCPQLNAAACWYVSLVACNKPEVLSDPLLSSPKSFSVIVTKLNCCSEVTSSSKTTTPKSNGSPLLGSNTNVCWLYPVDLTTNTCSPAGSD